MPSAGIVWGLVVVIAVLAILSISFVVGAIIHSRKIKESENRFKTLFNKVSDALIVFDISEKVTGLNDSAVELLGYSDTELLKFSLKDIVVKNEWLELHEEFERTFIENSEHRGESKLITKDGKLVQVEAVVVGLNLGGDRYVLVSFRDITKRKEAEKNLYSKHTALQEILAHIEGEKMKFKQRVAETVEQVMMPTMNKMRNKDGTIVDSYYKMLQTSLKELVEFSGSKDHFFSKLSPREIEICNLIKNGHTTKEIAEMLSISFLTVNKHRERIRKKLGVSNKDINLSSFLKNK